MNFLQGDVIKNSAVLFLFIVAVGAFGIYAYDIIRSVPVPDVIMQVVTGSIGVALTAAGFNHGVTVANGTAQDTANSTVAAFIKSNNTQPLPGASNVGQNKSDGGLTTK